MKFNRYWICDKSGSGREKWHYFIGDYNGDYEYARDFILYREEEWALHADSYSLEIELDVEAPQEFIKEKIVEYAEQVVYAQKTLDELKSLINHKELK